MLVLDIKDLAKQTDAYAGSLKKGASAPLMFNDYIKKTLISVNKKINIEYPRTIKIPKSINKLVKGDTEPLDIITINEPFEYNGYPIWFGDSSKGVYVRFGYLNGDSRYPCDQRLDDKDIHMLLAGATGHGKSVTLNAGIYGVAMEYAPWEVNLTMCDAKIVEFRKYVGDELLPHVSSIGATGDADYIISVLTEKRDEMMLINKAFSAIGASNIENYRKKTGLAIPQNLIIIDEFQTMFANAGKQTKDLEKVFADFSKLGRSSGYHLVLSSQQFGSEIPEATLNQILVRAALGAQENVSEKILGNKAAANNLGTKGKLIINTNPASHDIKQNKNYRVPLLTDDDFIVHRENLSKLADKVGFRRQMSYFDEDSLMNEEEMTELCRKYANPNRILLGEPSFVMREEDKVNYVKMLFSGRDIENVFVYAQNRKELTRLCKTVCCNMEAISSSCRNLMLVADEELKQEVGFNDTIFVSKEAKTYDSLGMLSMMYSTYLKKLALYVDNLAGEACKTNEDIDKIFYTIIDKGSALDTVRNRSRFLYGMSSLQQKDFERLLWSEYGKIDRSDRNVNDTLKSMLNFFHSMNADSKHIYKLDLVPTFIWILGINKMIGLGRDSKSSMMEDFKKILFDANETNTRFMVVSSSTEEMGALKSAFKYFLLGRVQENQVSRIGLADFYPNQIADKMCVLCCPTDDKYSTCKFKQMLLEGED